MPKPKVAVLLSGCGVYDGSEIHEAVLTLLSLDEAGAEYQCIAPDIEQHHVVNHLTGEEMAEKRNVLVEAARIARGNIKPLHMVKADDYDALIMPGGFGSAKNLTGWAFSGPDGEIHPEVKRFIQDMVKTHKPVVALCMSPVVIAKALEGSGIQARLTVGTTAQKSPYDIAAVSSGLNKTGAVAEMAAVDEIVVDEKNKIITTPCYMMEAGIRQIYDGIRKAVSRLMEWL
ncbi:MAG: glyoxalase [Chitinophagales bacterium]|nr:MAG: glyoxalase [Chitinophagales bacterium]